MPSRERLEDLVAMWYIAVDENRSTGRRMLTSHQAAFAALAAHDDTLLRDALHERHDAEKRVRGLPTPPQWLEAVRTKAAARTTGVRLDVSSGGRLKAWELVEDRARVLDRLALPFPQEVLQQALQRLRRRVGEAEVAAHLLKRRSPRWRTSPSRSLVGAPVIDVDEVEVAVVSVLAATAQQWQFSSTPAGHMFLGRKLGYHREDERCYVSGLSDLLDTASGLAESHRAGAGGRVYVTSRWVECAECKLVLAWVGEPGSKATAFRTCSAIARSRRR